ncbi:hypothetical protein DNHGIG_13530 [Collibacillus ludicampi]|uniref:Transposase n=1 Tax=Collibacillus ludicampi TaxID=2771369 RepID=A0AAV4LDM3_9BACL|nr:hypothetical protein [Collibacillus ludicampi]GIM45804.1 hypothetical protein DNHGIG_13530 [Collibacillus ludicampi]
MQGMGPPSGGLFSYWRYHMNNRQSKLARSRIEVVDQETLL